MARNNKVRRPLSRFGFTAADRLVEEYYKTVNFSFNNVFDYDTHNKFTKEITKIAKATRVDAQELADRWYEG